VCAESHRQHEHQLEQHDYALHVTDGPQIESAPDRVEQSAPAAPAASPTEPTVLIVQDDLDMLDLLTIWVEAEDGTVLPAASAQEALIRADGKRVHLAVLDLLLPPDGMNGWQLTAHLREQHPDTLIAVCSILDPPDYPPCDYELPKPCSREDVAALMRWLRRQDTAPAS
jgi:CheY-like chemotaxis protein